MELRTDKPDVDIDYSIPGMRIERYPQEAEWTLVVRSMTPRLDWVLTPTSTVDRISIKEVPTTIMYRGMAYMIVEAEEKEETWIYRNMPWPDGEPRIKIFDLSREAIEEEAREEKEDKKEAILTQSSVYYDWLLGWLPGSFQEKLSQKMLFDPKEASQKNAFFEWVFGLTCLILLILILVLMRSENVILFMVPFFFTFEGFIRWGHVMTSEKPLGLFFLEGCVFVSKVAKKTIAQDRSRLKK